MEVDHQAGPDVYKASKFWDQLNQKNVEWLRNEGLDNFKRTVNNNYFNWMVSFRSDYFKNVAIRFFRSAIRKPGKIVSALTVNIGEMIHKTYTSTVTQKSYLQRKIYALYLLFLYDFVESQDKWGLYKCLEEPLVGNPLFIQIDGKRISQDISNSYMEYSYVRQSLGDEFTTIKNIAEIGGGYGRLAYLFHLFHQKDGVRIVLIDLPPALLVAQWYLRQVLPDAKFMDYRHFTDFNEIKKEFNDSSICFLLPHQFELIPAGTLDLLINVSSLQEMSREQINHYYALVDAKAKYFYTKQWISWENPIDQMTVPAVIYPTRPSWELEAARLNPIHSQFFEAVFKVEAGKS